MGIEPLPTFRLGSLDRCLQFVARHVWIADGHRDP